MKQNIMNLLLLALSMSFSISCNNEKLEPAEELTFMQELADQLITHGYIVKLEGNKISIHRSSIDASGELAVIVSEFLTEKEISIDRSDLDNGIQLGFNSSDLQRAKIKCGSTGWHHGASGSCKFYYCWDDNNPDYYHMETVCYSDDGEVTSEVEESN